MSYEIRLMADHDSLYRLVIKDDNMEIFSKSGLTFQEAITEVENNPLTSAIGSMAKEHQNKAR